jgi:ABC-type multidrug transport system permease subunit
VRNTWTLSISRIRLAMRSKPFIFFSFVMPMAFLFGYVLIFGRGSPTALQYLLGAILGLTVMGSFWGLSMQLVMFRETGILRRFRVAPIGAGAMLGSSIISNYFLTLPTIVIEFMICRWVFKMPSWGNLWGVFLLVSVGAATFSAFGLIVASVTNNVQETQVINNVIWMGFLFLSGATIPLGFLPHWIQRVALFLPATYLVTGLEGAMLWTASARALAEDFFILAIGFLIAFEISRQLFRWDPEARVPGRAKLWAAAAMVPFLLMGTWENVYGSRLNQIRTEFVRMQERATPSQPK